MAIIENDILIEASPAAVERCFTDLERMRRWLHPLLRIEPVPREGPWRTDLGAESRFTLAIPGLEPSLVSRVVRRDPQRIHWAFDGFFVGEDHWHWAPESGGCRLHNRFEFTIPNRVVAWGYERFGAPLTGRDMAAQLERIRDLARADDQG